MKLFKLLYLKYTLSLSICFFSSFVMFFIFSLISNLNEEYEFNKIIELSFLNTLQILVYVPSFIFIISIILFTIFLRSNNEIIIVKSYLNIKKYLIFFLPIIVFFTFLEIEKKDLSKYLEDTKNNIFNLNNDLKAKIIIDDSEENKNYTIIKNINLNDTSNTEYWFYSISNNKINVAEFSDNLIINNNNLIMKNYTQYKEDKIKDFFNEKVIGSKFIKLIPKSSFVKYISKQKNIKFDVYLINLIVFFIFFLCFIFLFFFSSKFVSSKQSLLIPVSTCITILIYSFVIFNNSISAYKQEFELLASLVMGMFLLKVFLNE